MILKGPPLPICEHDEFGSATASFTVANSPASAAYMSVLLETASVLEARLEEIGSHGIACRQGHSS
jgi:hypothetical protein